MPAEFLGSFVVGSELPDRKEPVIAFLGRSNVGKSSLINWLTRSDIARVSKTPGRTQMLNLFLVDERVIFGDFPGYGFAKASKKQRAEFGRLIEHFLRSDLFDFAIQVVDSRHPGLDSDLEVHGWLREIGLDHVIIMNKADQLNQKERAEAERKAKDLFSGQPLLFASTFKKEGKRELEKIIRQIEER